MSASAGTWIERVSRELLDRGYSATQTAVPATAHFTKRVRNLGPFFPCTDFVFLFDVSSRGSQLRFPEWHEQARRSAEEQFRLPRALRYRIPNTVSIGFSDAGLTEEAIAFAESDKLESPLIGGHKHSAYLFDTQAERLYSPGLEVTPGRYGSRNVSGVNPTNRMYLLLCEVFGAKP